MPSGTLAKPLSKREMEILRYIADGSPNKRIALILDIASGTVANHITTINRKLGASNRAHAVSIAYMKNLIF